MYIGDKKVKVTIKGEIVIVNPENGTKFEINKELWEKIKSDKKGLGNVTDIINDYFCRKFLAELALYDLDYMFAMSIGSGIATLAHNLREQAIGKALDCSCSETVKLSKIIDEM